MATALTVYGTTQTSGVLGTAKQLATSSGAASSGFDTTLGTATGYSEIFPMGTGSAWQALGSIPGAASGNGYILDATTLEGQTIAAGTYTDTVRARINGGTGNATASFYTRIGKRASGGAITFAGTLSLTGQTITNGVSANYSVTGSLSALSFATGDKLYIERWANVTVGVTGAANFRVDTSTTNGQGSTNCQCVTPGYDPSILGGSRPITGVSTALKALGITRSFDTISVATKAFGVPRPVMSIKAAVGFPAYAETLGVALSGSYVPVQQSGISFDQKIDSTAGGSFVIDDPDGVTYPVQENQQVDIQDTQAGKVLYRGFVDKVDEGRVTAPSYTRRTITLKDLRAIGEKRLCTADYTNWTAGNIAADLVRSRLAGESITANFAMRRDHDATGFGAGTLTNTTATNGYLELARAGTDVTHTDTTTSDFAAGTLSGVTAANNQLTLTPYTALKLNGTCGTNVGVNKGNYFTYWTIWTGSIALSVAFEYLEYYVWMPSTTASLNGAIDLVCTDGTTLRDRHTLDQLGLDCHPGNNLDGWCDDQWLYRKIYLNDLVGKTICRAMVAFDSDKEGLHTAYFRDVYWRNSGGGTRATIFAGTLQKKTRVSQVGYTNVSIGTVTAYAERGSRIAPSLSLTGAGKAGQSLLGWSETLPDQGASSSNSSGTEATNSEKTTAQLTVETSIDGGDTWQACTKNGAIPSLPTGMNLSGVSLLVKQTLAVGGPNPELSPSVQDTLVRVGSAYNATTTDVARSYAGSEMTDGTNSGCGYQAAVNTAGGWQRNDVSGLKMNGYRKNWRTGELTNITLLGPSSDRAVYEVNGALALQTNDSVGAHVSFDSAGSYDGVIIECDIQLNTCVNAGVLYRTTYWASVDNSWGFYAYIQANEIGIGHGSNSIGGGWSGITHVVASLATDKFYHLKVVCGTDDVHHIYVDDIEYVTYTDSSYSSSGDVGVRAFANGNTRSIAYFDNFGVSSNTGLSQATRTAPSQSIAAAGHVGDSRIWWIEDVPAGCTLEVKTSINAGVDYTLCTNGGTIPGLTPGLDLTGISLLVRTYLNSESIAYTPALLGISWLVTGQFSTSGSRVSPVLACDDAEAVGSSSVTWDAEIPASGTLGVDSSLNGSSWSALSSSGDAVIGLTEQGDVVWDNFDTDSHTSYSYTSGHWTWDTANSRLVSAGTSDLLYHSATTVRDAELTAICSRADGLELVVRNSGSGHYILRCYDNSGSIPHTLALRKYTPGGGDVLLASTADLDFARGTYRTLRLLLEDDTLTAYFDGTQVLTYDDGSALAGTGTCGLYHPGTVNYIHDLAIRPLGQAATGINVYTRTRLTSTDPLSSPKVRDLVACVRSPLIATGAVIPQTKDWAYKQTVAGALDELSASMSWRFNESYQLVMRPRDGEIAPFVLATANENIEAPNPPKVQRSSPEYRNRQYITGAIELVEWPESKLGNGVDTSWTLTYPIDTLEEITINGQAQTFGVKDTDTGKTFYYTPGEPTLSLAEGGTPPTTQIDITYIGRKPYRAMSEDTAQQAILATLEGGTGIYERSEDIGGLSKDAADALAIARIAQYARLAVNWSATTRVGGLAPGQLLTVIVPEHGLDDLQFLITGVSTSVRMQGDDTLLYWYDVEATTGPSLGGWARSLSSKVLKKGGTS